MKDETGRHVDLSIVIPYRDEAPNLRRLYDELAQMLGTLSESAEILFVDDASRDDGAAIIEALAATDSRVRSLRLTPHSGQSAALEAGFRGAEGAAIATLDADLQNDPADLPALLGALSEADCVCGIREHRHDALSTRLASRLANTLRRWVLGDGITDIGCSLRVMRAEPLSRIALFHGGHRFLPALMKMQGARVVERSVRHRPRAHGQSKYGILRRGRAVWIDLLGVLWWSRRIDRYEVKELSRSAASERPR